MTKTFTATAPDGSTHKRTSANREYPFAVLVGPADPAVLAKRSAQYAADQQATIDTIEAALSEPQVTIKSRGFGPRGGDPDAGYNGEHSYHHYEVRLKGTDLIWHSDSKGQVHDTIGLAGEGGAIVPAKAALIGYAKSVLEQAAKAKVNFEASAVTYGEAAAKGETVGAWGAVRWTSRRDLGEKFIQGEGSRYRTFEGSPIIIVETTSNEGRK